MFIIFSERIIFVCVHICIYLYLYIHKISRCVYLFQTRKIWNKNLFLLYLNTYHNFNSYFYYSFFFKVFLNIGGRGVKCPSGPGQ